MFDPAITVLMLEKPLPADLDDCETRLRNIARLRSWLSNKHAEAVRTIATIESSSNSRTGPKRARDRVKAATGCSDRDAKRDTAAAEQLSSMSSTRKGLGQGKISSANAQALARLRESLTVDRQALFDGDETRLAKLAAEQTSDEFRATLRDWAHTNSGDDGISDTQRRQARRKLTITTGDDNMSVLRAELDPENIETVRRAISDIATEMWHGKHSAHLEGAPHITNNQRLMADALIELCRRGSTVTADGGRRNRPTVIVTINHNQLIRDLERHGISARLADGSPIPAETARRLACDANLLPIVLGGQGQPLDVGRTRRLATDAQRAALRTLYPTCSAQSCQIPFDWCDIHHITPWQRGGNTDLDDLAPLCSGHHHLVHEDGWTTTRQPNGSIRFHPKLDPPPPQTRRPGPETSGPRVEAHPQPTLV